MNWERVLRSMGAVFKHDGNPKRPYVRLTSGLITNEYFNSRVLISHARLFGMACEALLSTSTSRNICTNMPRADKKRWYVVGAAQGGISIAVRCAEVLGIQAAYADKDDGQLVFKDFELQQRLFFLPVEDALTTLGTIVKLRRACEEASFSCVFIERVHAFWNWTGEDEYLGCGISSLVKRKLLVWEDGENPFTGGPELVRPIERPKEHWRAVMATRW